MTDIIAHHPGKGAAFFRKNIGEKNFVRVLGGDASLIDDIARLNTDISANPFAAKLEQMRAAGEAPLPSSTAKRALEAARAEANPELTALESSLKKAKLETALAVETAARITAEAEGRIKTAEASTAESNSAKAKSDAARSAAEAEMAEAERDLRVLEVRQAVRRIKESYTEDIMRARAKTTRALVRNHGMTPMEVGMMREAVAAEGRKGSLLDDQPMPDPVRITVGDLVGAATGVKRQARVSEFFPRTGQ